ncbi:hypothetical protein AGDE_06582 [Angomonas deanei]|uniref:Leucine Rich repeat n=1 Tax=Angomonas deanei TaxID=59799 RepID=A0A7G2CB17_9TRYP|nr:hypothetical protein AGDE_06582 [Angomonas deanei]CAD2216986.1 hypothetical protein, conserved [Angomonas deanei]|eukprot:EPY37352.1 hypothetical protein AGDE_06582 [Angomonas deanei]
MSSRELAEFRGRRLEVANTALAFDALQAPENMEFLSLTGVKLVNFSWEGFTKLSTVFLARTSLESLDELCKCKNLSTVNLWGCASVTTVAGVSQLWNLKELFLQETSITDKGIDELKKCTQLEKLNMGGCVNLTNVNCLGTLVSLEELHLWSTKVVNSGIIGLGNCVSLVELVLDDCKKISDVNCLSGLRRLRYLSVIGTSVNSEGIRHLLRCPKLECLSICGAEIHHAPKLWNHESVVAFLSTL